MHEFDTTMLIIGLLIIYPLLFIVSKKELAARETQEQFEKRSKENNIAVSIFSLLVMSGVIFNATFY